MHQVHIYTTVLKKCKSLKGSKLSTLIAVVSPEIKILWHSDNVYMYGEGAATHPPTNTSPPVSFVPRCSTSPLLFKNTVSLLLIDTSSRSTFLAGQAQRKQSQPKVIWKKHARAKWQCCNKIQLLFFWLKLMTII